MEEGIFLLCQNKVVSFTEKLKQYLPYLEDLRRRLVWSTLIFCAVFIVGFFSAGKIIKYFVHMFNIDNVVLATSSPFQFASLAMDIGFFSALLITLPLVIFHIFSFTSSALTTKEKKWFFFSVPISLFLFCLGFFYSFLILYYSFDLLARLNESFGIKNIWDIGTFLSQIFITSSLLGIVFQFPIILTVLIRLTILNVNFLKEKRRVAIFSIVVLTALLPPTDGLSLLAMVVPLIVLYEATILINLNKTNVWIRN